VQTSILINKLIPRTKKSVEINFVVKG